MLAVRGNKQIKIDEAEKATYLALGYDIAEVDTDSNSLKITDTAPGKTVPYATYKESLDKVASLEAEIDAINKAAKK